jgi:hypothetical protein
MSRHPRPTDHKRLNLAELHHQVAFGRSEGKIIWQPRIGCWITDKRFAGTPLPEPYEGMEYFDIFRHLECSTRLYEYNACFRQIEDSRVVCRENQINETDTEHIVETPVGTQRAIDRRTPTSWYHESLKRWIASEEEMRVALWRAERATFEWDEARYRQLQAEAGDLGAPTMFMPRVNVQDLYINTMGVEAGVLALFERPDAVRAYFRALDDLHDRMIDVINASPIEIINFGDNLHGGTLSPPLFREYVLPAYQRRCEKLHAAGKFVCSHWDGDTKTLLPFARETGLDGIEAITPKPQGDVTLEEVKEALGDDLLLLDGIPAIYFDEIFPVEELEACVEKIIDLFAPRLILGISDEISSTGDIKRIRAVGRIVDDYNAAVASGAASQS